MNKAIEWLKGTCNYKLFKFYMQDIEVAIRMAEQIGKEKVFDDIDKLDKGFEGGITVELDEEQYRKLKKKHLNTSNTETKKKGFTKETVKSFWKDKKEGENGD